MSAFVWIGGRPSLDLCNTAAGGTDLLCDPTDIADWLVEAGLGTPEHVPESRDLNRIKQLRANLRAAFVAHDAAVIADVVADWLGETPGRLSVDRASLRPSFCPEVSTCRCLLVPALLDALDLAWTASSACGNAPRPTAPTSTPTPAVTAAAAGVRWNAAARAPKPTPTTRAAAPRDRPLPSKAAARDTNSSSSGSRRGRGTTAAQRSSRLAPIVSNRRLINPSAACATSAASLRVTTEHCQQARGADVQAAEEAADPPVLVW